MLLWIGVTRQVKNVLRNTELRSCNICCSGKNMSITYCECVFVALVTQQAMFKRQIVIRSLPRSIIFFHVFL
jgi:hypothetical protein